MPALVRCFPEFSSLPVNPVVPSTASVLTFRNRHYHPFKVKTVLQSKQRQRTVVYLTANPTVAGLWAFAVAEVNP